MDEKPPTWAENFPSNYKIEVVELGVQKTSFRFNTNKQIFSIGRITTCDGLLDHITVSKLHAIFVYGKNGHEDSKFWIKDLGSQNGTKINKKLIQPHIFVSFTEDDIIQIAQDRFSLFLQKDQILRPRTIKTANLELNTPTSVEKQENTQNDIVFENPMEMIRVYFEQKGLEPEYEVEQIENLFRVRLNLTIYDEDGEELVAEAECRNKKSATEKCAIKACEIISKNDLEFLQKAETTKERKERELIENDYYDDDDDMFFDRSGQVEKKRSLRMKNRGVTNDEPVHSYQSLSAKLKLIQNDIVDTEDKISRHKTKNDLPEADEDADELDAYMKDLQSEVDQKVIIRFENQLTQLRKEEEEILRILPKLAPSSLIDIPQKITPHVPPSTPSNTLQKRKTQNKPTDTKRHKDSQDLNVNNKYGESEDLNEWIPPSNQLGDGITELNLKYKY